LGSNYAHILHGRARIAHVTGHLLAPQHMPRRLVLADGTRRTMRLGIAMGGALTAEIMPLDRAGIALADGTTDDINVLPHLEAGHIQFVTDADLGRLFFLGSRSRHRPLFMIL